MTELTTSKSDGEAETPIPDGIASLESILCTEELHRRPWRPPDHATENRALVALNSALTESPRTILQTLADTILEVTRSDSAGVSLLTQNHAITVSNTGGGLPHNHGHKEKVNS